MRNVKSEIIKLEGKYCIPIEKQLLDFLGLKEGDEIEFEPKKIFELPKELIDATKEIKIKMVDTCFKYGVATLSTKDRKFFPEDKHHFLMEIDGKLQRKHVASLKIAMKDFFDNHSKLEDKEYITIKIIRPFEEYKLVY